MKHSQTFFSISHSKHSLISNAPFFWKMSFLVDNYYFFYFLIVFITFCEKLMFWKLLNFPPWIMSTENELQFHASCKVLFASKASLKSWSSSMPSCRVRLHSCVWRLCAAVTLENESHFCNISSSHACFRRTNSVLLRLPLVRDPIRYGIKAVKFPRIPVPFWKVKPCPDIFLSAGKIWRKQ